jgi:hypothetical protein
MFARLDEKRKNGEGFKLRDLSPKRHVFYYHHSGKICPYMQGRFCKVDPGLERWNQKRVQTSIFGFISFFVACSQPRQCISLESCTVFQ